MAASPSGNCPQEFAHYGSKIHTRTFPFYPFLTFVLLFCFSLGFPFFLFLLIFFSAYTTNSISFISPLIPEFLLPNPVFS